MVATRRGSRKRPRAAASDLVDGAGASRRAATNGVIARLPGWQLPFHFLLALFKRSYEDRIVVLSAALAFVSVTSLVPLLAAFSFIGRQLFDSYRTKIVAALEQMLPYSQGAIADRLQEFLTQSESLPRFGLVAFAVVSLAAFGTLEEVLNRIWRVTVERPFRVRLLSFTLLLFWGPLLIGASFSALLLIQQRPDFAAILEQAAFLRAVPYIVIVLALTMLYWMVPYAPVRFSSALAGGLAAGSLFELLRHAFGWYVDSFGWSTNLVYGGFAVALFFLLSIEAAWVLVLLGCEIAFLVQHPVHFGPRPPVAAPLREAWAGLVALTFLVVRFRQGLPIAPLVALEARLGLPADEIRILLQPLVEAGLVAHPTPTETDAFLLARDPHTVSVADALAAYDLPRQEALATLDPALGDRLTALADRLVQAREGATCELTLAELAAGQAAA